MVSDLDPRVHPIRRDVAAEHLRGRVVAERYAQGRTHTVDVGVTGIYRDAAHTAMRDTEALFGETFIVYDQAGGWAWGQLEADGYVGYVEASALSPGRRMPTHRVATLGAFVFAEPDIKSAVRVALSYGSLLAAKNDLSEFVELASGGFVSAQHVEPAGAHAADFVAEAERFIGVPYLWGGRSRLGVDCSGLVQLALMACGVASPRDSDMQAAVLGIDTPENGLPRRFQRGDLLYWRGHIGIMRDSDTLLHANAHHMDVASEPVADAMSRIAAKGTPLLAVRRMTPDSPGV